MLETKYYKDYRHNYLIIKDNGCLTENVYQRKMMTENKIKGLLSSSEKHINGELLLYFEITSKQSLQSFFGGRSIGMEFLKKFFVQLKMVNDTLQKYLLDGSCIVLLPEYIFLDVGTEDMYFLYYPDPEEGNLSGLMDFFMAEVDNEDMEAVETVYRIADLIQRDQFVLDEVLEWFQDGCADRVNQGVLGEDCLNADNLWEKEIIQTCIEKDDHKLGNSHQKEEAGNVKRITQLVPLLIFLTVGAGVLIYVMCSYHLSYLEKIYLTAGWGIIAFLLIGAAIWYFAPEILKGRKEKEHREVSKDYGLVPTNETSISLEKEVGNTVFIPWTENCENKLYGADRKNKYHIDLGKLPLTVGKLAGMVDMIIDEQSISRMHARFSRTGNRIYITDLNSTNGTFRNGMRLEPNASELIEPGDEIRLGKLKFIYR
ncbi:MAG: FHA domain-containing protein [Lachnospiraceae bacterium]|nr:FHA domain-containing protein [Lachnospiraceae bacterium]